MHLILQTPRLYLRRFTMADTSLIVQLNSRTEVLQYLHEVPVKDEAHAAEILQTIILPQYENNLGRWATHIKETDEFIGWCGLKHRPEIAEVDLGYRFLPEFWGRGYATEAAKYALEYGFTTLGLKAVTGRAHIENAASLKVLEKIGMQYIKDEEVDHCPVKTFIAEKGSR
jgi:[ribosomal protein S5]-alanine N-acetyltransferase